MRNSLEIVKATETFRRTVEKLANQPAGRKSLMRALNTTYPTIGRIINTGFVRFQTLVLFVEKLEGPGKDVEDYITKDLVEENS